MPSKRVVFCGADIVGKRELVESIAKLNGVKTKWVWHKSDVTVHCQIGDSEHSVELVSFTGAAFYFDELVPAILSTADLIVYVVGCEAERHALDVGFFEDYTRVASTVRKTWDDIPWLVVANKMDLGDSGKALEIVQRIKSKGTFPTNAKTGQGVPEFWEGLKKTIQAMP